MGAVRCGLNMLPFALSLAAAGVAIPASAQPATGLDPYRHAYDRENGYVAVPGLYGVGPYGYGFGGTTAAQAAGIGVGQAAQGLGQMHLQDAQAAAAYEQAVNQYIQNQGLAVQTLLRDASEKHQAEEQARERGEIDNARERAQVALYHKTMERMSAAHRLTAEQFDVDRGVLHWPFVLRGPEYADLRNKLDLLYDARTPEDSGKNSGGYAEIVAACDALQKMIKEDVQKGMPVTDFITANHFISSVRYEAQFRVKSPQADSTGRGAKAATGGE